MESISSATGRPASNASIRLIRHATLAVEVNGLKLLVDPMLSPAEFMDPVSNAENAFRIPMVELPLNDTELTGLLEEIDAVMVTHTHRDHWDETAIRLINKNKPVFCQPQDAELIGQQGFMNVMPVEEQTKWKGITISRTGGQHGTGDIGKAMGSVSGFVLKAGDDCIYIAGDTIWCGEVEDALLKYKPRDIILNTGGARFLTGDAITMTPEDVTRVCHTALEARVIAVHMDTVNHCLVTRGELARELIQRSLTSRVSIPADGEVLVC